MPNWRRRYDRHSQRLFLSERLSPFDQLREIAMEASLIRMQAAIAAVHAEAPSAGQTDWRQIVGLYDVLLRAVPSPVIELNRAVAVAMEQGPLAGLALVDNLLQRGELQDYHLAHSARGEFCRQLGRFDEARSAYEKALSLTQQAPEKRFITRRLAELNSSRQ